MELYGVSVPVVQKPRAGTFLLSWFHELSRARVYSGDIPQPISYHDIKVWSEMTGTTIKPHQVQALIELDEVYRAELIETQIWHKKRVARDKDKGWT